MRVNRGKLDLALARKCMSMSELRDWVAPQTLTRVRKGENIKPATLGRIAKALGVDVVDILEVD